MQNLRCYQWTLCTFYINIHWFSLHFEWIFNSCMVLIICHALVIWKILAHWVLRIFKCCHTSLYSIKKYFINIADLMRNIFSYWEISKLTVADVFFKILAFTESLNFGNKYCWLFSLKWKSLFIYFQEKNCQIPKFV